MPATAGRRRFHWRPFPRVPHPRTYSKAPHAPAHRQLLKHPSRRHPASADGPSPRRHTRITKSHPESSTGSAHVPTPPCHAGHGRAASLSLASLSRVPHPRAYSKAPFPSPPRFADSPSPRGHSRSAMKTTLKLPCPRHRAISQSHQSTAFASSPPTSQTPSPSPPRFRGRPFSAQTHAHHQESS